MWTKEPAEWGPDYYERIKPFELPQIHYQKLTGQREPALFAIRRRDGADRCGWRPPLGSAGGRPPPCGHSKGMQMRLTFARSLINDPSAVLGSPPLGPGERPQDTCDIIVDLKAALNDLFHHARHGHRRRAVRSVAFVVDGGSSHRTVPPN